MQSSPELNSPVIQNHVVEACGFPEEIPPFQEVQAHFANYLELLFLEEQRLFELQLVRTRQKQLPELVSYIDTLFQRLNDTVNLGYCYELIDDQQVTSYTERLTSWQQHVIHCFEQHERILLEPSLTATQRSQQIHGRFFGASLLGKSVLP